MMDDQNAPEYMTLHMVSKMELMVQHHDFLLKNVDQAHKKYKKTYATKKGHVMFQSFGERELSVNMKKPCKNKSLLASWDGPYLLVSYKNDKGCQVQDEGAKICILKDKDDQTWQRTRRHLDIYHTPWGVNLCKHRFSMLAAATCVT